MSLFQTILADLQKKLSQSEDECVHIAETMSTVLKTPISREQITFKKGVVYTKVPATIKMAIKIKEQELIRLLREKHISVISIH